MSLNAVVLVVWVVGGGVPHHKAAFPAATHDFPLTQNASSCTLGVPPAPVFVQIPWSHHTGTRPTLSNWDPYSFLGSDALWQHIFNMYNRDVTDYTSQALHMSVLHSCNLCNMLSPLLEICKGWCKWLSLLDIFAKPQTADKTYPQSLTSTSILCVI